MDFKILSSVLLFACFLSDALCLFFPPASKEARHLSTLNRRDKITALLHHLRGKKHENTKFKRDGDTRVSFKECNLSNGEKQDCGYYGITPEVCAQRECCYTETTEPDVPWCYHSIPTIRSVCSIHNDERVECGWYGIRKEQCLAKNCCWRPSNDGGVPWCFHEQEVPVFEGECGVPAVAPNAMSRIVGGIEANEHSWPWMVSLQSDDDHFCGGSLINNQWVVTAAHCEPAFWWGSRRTVVLGLHNQRERGEAVTIDVDLIIPHEDYGSANGYDHDIMLLKLAEPVEFREEITPVCLASEDSSFAGGRRCYTTGWGALSSGGSSPDTLQQVMVPLIETEVCNEERWYGGSIDDTMQCAGYEEGGRDSCQGDSGGPLVCFEDAWTLVGVVSWGEGCAYERKPGVYSKVSSLVGWVERTVSVNS